MYLSAAGLTGSSAAPRAPPSRARRGGRPCAPHAARRPPAIRPAARTSAAASARRSSRRSRPRAASPARPLTRSGSPLALSPRSGTHRSAPRSKRSFWMRIELGVEAGLSGEVDARHADGCVGLVDGAIGGDAQRVLGDALAGAERRRAGVTGARVDLVQLDHELGIPCNAAHPSAGRRQIKANALTAPSAGRR